MTAYPFPFEAWRDMPLADEHGDVLRDEVNTHAENLEQNGYTGTPILLRALLARIEKLEGSAA